MTVRLNFTFSIGKVDGFRLGAGRHGLLQGSQRMRDSDTSTLADCGGSTGQDVTVDGKESRETRIRNAWCAVARCRRPGRGSRSPDGVAKRPRIGSASRRAQWETPVRVVVRGVSSASRARRVHAIVTAPAPGHGAGRCNKRLFA